MNYEWLNEMDSFEFLKIYKFLPRVKGCYVLYNCTKDLYYIGQSKNVIKRLACHLNGRSGCCSDAYADYKYGDNFTVQILPLSGSGYDTLDEMERVLIRKLNAVDDGYNKMYGNPNG